MEKIAVEEINTSNLDQRDVYEVKEMLKSKQFYSLTDLVDFLEDNMEMMWRVWKQTRVHERHHRIRMHGFRVHLHKIGSNHLRVARSLP